MGSKLETDCRAEPGGAMGDLSTGTLPSKRPPKTLDSWKEIATYVKRTSPLFSAGKSARDAGSSACPRQARLGLCV